jgi:hypothetical protein
MRTPSILLIIFQLEVMKFPKTPPDWKSHFTAAINAGHFDDIAQLSVGYGQDVGDVPGIVKTVVAG